ncbi:MAG TPA: hypothetical protein DCZ94_19495 [Lentisphaeria bacterium]|nr:MAG: hypothetical protein A2X48_07640 [Lentisphaerae bacterium GWF2_49_21]HBC89129.1 hypothetical protein [Lentisphaeria bacterium]
MERRIPKRILLYQNIGFMMIIIISWLDEIIGLPSLMMGISHTHIWSEAILETIIVIAIWLPVHIMTKRILERLFYLENLVKMCAWCRKIEFNGKWYTQEEFYKQGFNAMVTHGICSDCFEKQEKEAKLLKEKTT